MTHSEETLDEERLTTPRLLAMKDEVVPLARELGLWARAESDRHQRHGHDLGVSAKTTPGDVVTAVDREVQRRLVEALRDAYPGFGFVGEEGLDAPLPGAPTWVIDPIDGTHNFVRDYPGFCVSIGLVAQGASVLGVIWDSVSGEAFWAVRGGGAWREGRRLRARGETRLASALLTTNFTAASAATPAHRRLFGELAGRSAGVRASGSACRDLCLVAAGSVDLFWQFDLKSWDVAAGIVLAREAGARCTLVDAPDEWLYAPGLAVFVGVPELVDEAVAMARD